MSERKKVELDVFVVATIIDLLTEYSAGRVDRKEDHISQSMISLLSTVVELSEKDAENEKV